MKLNKVKRLARIGAFVVAGCALTTIVKKDAPENSIDELVNTLTDSKVVANTVNELSEQTVSKRVFDTRYDFNEGDLLKFNSWIDSAIKNSRENKSYAIIVVKADYRLFLYKDGVLQKEFPVDLGENPYGPKQMGGDKKTPEGLYEIKKKALGSFHRALVLDYPNKNDLSEFWNLKKQGVIPDGKAIGHSIELHGGSIERKSGIYGGRNWTDGCVALLDRHIEELYNLLPLGTKVTIVRYADISLLK